MRVRETENEFGTPVTEYRCEACGETFTVCPAQPPENDPQWSGCMAPNCSSYDADRDFEKHFTDGGTVAERDGLLIPLRIVDGGKS